MTPKDIRNRVDQVVRILREEAALKAEVASLGGTVMTGEQHKQDLQKQRQLIDSITALRRDKILPIVRELVTFIAKSRAASRHA